MFAQVTAAQKHTVPVILRQRDGNRRRVGDNVQRKVAFFDGVRQRHGGDAVVQGNGFAVVQVL